MGAKIMDLRINSQVVTKHNKPMTGNNKKRTAIVKGGAYTWLIIVALTTLLPFLWMISTSLKPRPEIFFFRFFPLQPTISHYITVLTHWQYGKWFFNTIVVTVVTTLSTLFFCSLCGYALAKYKFWGRSLFFALILSTIMVPTEMLLIPWYVGAYNLGISNSMAGVVFPGLISAFGVFVMRQAFLNIPNELLDAARVDGMTELSIFFKIALPLVSSALVTLGILTAVGAWNDYLWPLVVLTSINHLTVQLGMTYAAAAETSEATTVAWDVIMTSTTIATLPMLVLIIILQKYFVKGIALTGLKQ
jgi:multiple sugar transport system permease protein